MKWEYLQIWGSRTEDNTPKLDDMGVAGWELCASYVALNKYEPGEDGLVFILKRQLKEKE